MDYITNATVLTTENQRKMIFSLKKAFPSIALGVLTAGAIVTFVTYLVPVIARFFA